MPFQYGCAAVNFTLTGGWGSLVATVNDMDGTSGSPPDEFEGPNGCTYEPTSNTGIVIVRHLLGSSGNSNNAQNQFYSLLDTGVLP